MIGISLYLVFIAIFLFYSIAGLYHLWRFGFAGDLTRPVIFLYSLLSALIIVTTLIFSFVVLGER